MVVDIDVVQATEMFGLVCLWRTFFASYISLSCCGGWGCCLQGVESHGMGFRFACVIEGMGDWLHSDCPIDGLVEW